MDPRRILKIAKAKGLDTVAITDHNTIRGALEAKKYEDENGILVIIGSEIRTDIGDLIGLNLEREIISTSWEMVITEIKDQGGITVLPHPYRGHKMINEVAKKVDLIEVWNARCNTAQNKLAYELASSLSCNTIFGSDSHLYSEIGNVCVQSDPITLSTIKVLETKYANSSEIKWSQILGHIRKNDVINLICKGSKYVWKKITY